MSLYSPINILSVSYSTYCTLTDHATQYKAFKPRWTEKQREKSLAECNQLQLIAYWYQTF